MTRRLPAPGQVNDGLGDSVVGYEIGDTAGELFSGLNFNRQALFAPLRHMSSEVNNIGEPGALQGEPRNSCAQPVFTINDDRFVPVDRQFVGAPEDRPKRDMYSTGDVSFVILPACTDIDDSWRFA